MVTLASPNFLMPPAPMHTQSQSSHSSQEDCSGISYTVKHKLQEHLMRKHSNCDILSASAQASSSGAAGTSSQVKMRPVIRTYSAPLPLTNPAFFQPSVPPTPGMPPGAPSLDPYPIPTSDQEMYNIKQHIRNNGLSKSKVSELPTERSVSNLFFVNKNHAT